jgi:hypothetical protein
MHRSTPPFRPLALALTAALVGAACGESPTDVPSDLPVAEAAVANTSSEKVPLFISSLIECAADGAGEVVVLDGTLHVLFHETFNDAGVAVFKGHFQPQRLTGYGLTTGDRYQGTGVTQDITVLRDNGVSFSFNNNYRIIGQGPGNNFTVHTVEHVTVNANGELTAEVVVDRVDCG